LGKYAYELADDIEEIFGDWSDYVKEDKE